MENVEPLSELDIKRHVSILDLDYYSIVSYRHESLQKLILMGFQFPQDFYSRTIGKFLQSRSILIKSAKT
jgi:hypothetical protein